MKMLVFTDPHSNINLYEQHLATSKDVDAVLISGDLTYAGIDLDEVLALLETFAAPVYVIQGNHEDEEELAARCKSLTNVTFVHKKIVQLGTYYLGGFGTSGMRTNYPDFAEWIDEHRQELTQAKPLLWMDHPPPRDTAIDELAADWHVGSQTLREFIEEFQPMYVFCGHIHETFGVEDCIKDTIIINSGPTGRIIELP